MEMPKLGATVQYKLSEQDVQYINQTVPRINSAAGSNLNQPHAGDVYPGVVVRRFGGCVNLKVQLDGGPGAEYWATSRAEGDEEGKWTV